MTICQYPHGRNSLNPAASKRVPRRCRFSFGERIVTLFAGAWLPLSVRSVLLTLFALLESDLRAG
jgi:hypothetical protein